MHVNWRHWVPERIFCFFWYHWYKRSEWNVYSNMYINIYIYIIEHGKLQFETSHNCFLHLSTARTWYLMSFHVAPVMPTTLRLGPDLRWHEQGAFHTRDGMFAGWAGWNWMKLLHMETSWEGTTWKIKQKTLNRSIKSIHISHQHSRPNPADFMRLQGQHLVCVQLVKFTSGVKCDRITRSMLRRRRCVLRSEVIGLCLLLGKTQTSSFYLLLAYTLRPSLLVHFRKPRKASWMTTKITTSRYLMNFPHLASFWIQFKDWRVSLRSWSLGRRHGCMHPCPFANEPAMWLTQTQMAESLTHDDWRLVVRNIQT